MLRARQILAAVAATLLTTGAFAAGGADYPPSGIDRDNIQSLQRGAANFMNYCSGCHSAEYVRYNTIGKHLELSEQQLIDNLMFNADKTFETINVNMPMDEAVTWFGAAPPDLSLTARAKSADYIYNFLKGFYIDEDQTHGVNNRWLAGTSMPHVLGELQGYQRAIYDEQVGEDGSVTRTFVEFEQVIPGELDAEAYDNFVRDTTNFLAYIAEPVRSERRKLGVWVIMFLTLFGILAYMLKKEIWKDVK